MWKEQGVALKLFNVAIKSWQCSVMEAYQKASEVANVSVRTIERCVSLRIDEIEDDVVLSSNRGKSTKNPFSLIKKMMSSAVMPESTLKSVKKD